MLRPFAPSFPGSHFPAVIALGLLGAHLGFVQAAPPPNDSFAASIPILEVPATVTGTTAEATVEPQEGVHGSWRANSIWWSWTSSRRELAVLDVVGLTFVPVVSVYTGTDLSALTLVARQSASVAASGTAFLARPGERYHFAIDVISGTPGEVGLHLFTHPEPSPAPDRFADRPLLAGRTNLLEVVNVGYGREAGEPLIGSNPGGRSAWWSWTAPSDGWVEIESKANPLQPILGVYTGSMPSNLVAVVSAVAPAPATDLVTRFRATAGTAYAVTIDDRFGGTGYFRLAIRQPAGPPVVLDSPRTQTLGRGSPLALTAAVSGDRPMSFVWLRNGEPIPDSDRDTLDFPNVFEAHAGTYEVTARNALGAATAPAFEILLATNVVSFAAATLDLLEAESINVGLTRSGFTNAFQVRVRVEGTAIPGSDFQPPATVVSFPAGSTSASLGLRSLDDAVEAPPRTIRIALETGDTYDLGAISGVTITQTDDDPNVRIAVDDPFSREVDQDPGLFRIVRTGSLDRELSVPLAWAGSAVPGHDFEAIGDHLVLPAGSTEGLVPIRPRTTPESGDRLVQLQLAPGGTARLRSPTTASIRILGNRPPGLRWTAPAPWTRVPEGTPVEWAVTVFDPDGPLPGRIELLDGQARLGTFEGPPYHGRITLARGAHLLVARAVDPQGSPGESPLVPVLLGSPETTPAPGPFAFPASEPDPAAARFAGSDDSLDVTPSHDGRWIAFASRAADLLAFPPARDSLGFAAQLYLHEVDTGMLRGLSWTGAGESGRRDSFGARFATDAARLVFESFADNLAAYDDNGEPDVFLVNLPEGRPLLISARHGNSDVTGAGPSRSPSISGDGLLVAFQSDAPDLVAGDTNGYADVFLRRVDQGQTELISRPTSGVGLANGPSESPILSRNGRRLAFLSRATNLVEGAPPNSVDLLVRDLRTGTVWSARESVLEAVRAWSLPASASYRCYNASLDADGRRVAFKAEFTPGRPTLVLHADLDTGTTRVVTTNAARAWLPGHDATLSELSADGQTLACESTNHVFVWNAGTDSARSLGVHARTGEPLAGSSWSPRLSADGRFVVFLSDAAGWVEGVADGLPHAYRHDLVTGITTVAVVAADGTPAPFPDASPPELSGDGQVLAFASSESGLVAGDANERQDAFARVGTGTNRLLSVRSPGRAAPAPAIDEGPAPGRVSADGRFVAVAVTTAMEAWDPSDTNEIRDVYRLDLVDGSRVRVSATPDGVASVGGGRSPVISADGQVVAFVSSAGDLTVGDDNGRDDVFVHDVASGRTVLASSNRLGRASSNVSGASVTGAPLLSADGGWVAFVSGYRDLVLDFVLGPQLFLRHWRSGALVRVTNAWSSATSKTLVPLALRGPSNVVYLHSATNAANVFLLQSDAVAKTNRVLGPVLGRPAVTPSARFAAFRRRFAPDHPAVLVDLSDGREVATFPTGLSATNLAVSDVTVSEDGTRFAFETARDLDPGRDRNGMPDVYVWDARWPSPRLASVDLLGARAGHAGATRPVLGVNGRFVAFTSRSSDLAPGLRRGEGLWLHDLDSGKTWPVADLNPGPGLGGAYGAPGFHSDTPQLLFRSLAAQLSGETRETPRPILAFVLGSELDRDLDGDRLEDGWEFRQFGHLIRDGSSDADQDGWSDLQEFWLGTDPRRPGPGLVLSLPLPDPANAGVLVLEWPATPGRRYQIEATDALASGSWTVLASDLRPPGVLGRFHVALPANPADPPEIRDPAAAPMYRFFRVLLTP